MNVIKTLFILLGLIITHHVQAINLPKSLMSNVPPPNLNAKSWVLMEAETQWIIAENNPDLRIEPASLTKLMTLYVLFGLIEEGQFGMQDLVRISEKARYAEGSRMFAELNSEISVLELLKSIVVQSGNDASIALAEHAAGTEAGFAVLMNEAAKKLQLKNSNFKNSSGLPDDDHYSSARDMAILSQALINDFPQYYPWFSIPEMTYNNISQKNRNRLLQRADWVDGLKTGYTKSAGYCLAASGKQENTRFIAVVIGSDSVKARTDATYSLLQYGFANYEYYSPSANELNKNIQVYGGEQDVAEISPSTGIHVVVPKAEANTDFKNLDLDFRLEEYLSAPVSAGENAGLVRLNYKGEMIATSAMETKQPVALGSLFKRIKDSIKRML